MMDYGIIFIIIIVIIILIAIVLLIYANRSNVTNILATFPSYRIQYVDNLLTTNNYLGLRNVPKYSINNGNGGLIPRQYIDFYESFVFSGASNTDPMGIWKIENIQQNNNIPITSGSEVYIANYVYFSQTANQTGYLTFETPSIGRIPIKPTADIKNAAIFIYTIVGNNLFTLHSKSGKLPIIVDRTNNLFVADPNPNVKPSVFKLDFQLQKSQ
jgi:hypothetical protein